MEDNSRAPSIWKHCLPENSIVVEMKAAVNSTNNGADFVLLLMDVQTNQKQLIGIISTTGDTLWTISGDVVSFDIAPQGSFVAYGDESNIYVINTLTGDATSNPAGKVGNISVSDSFIVNCPFTLYQVDTDSGSITQVYQIEQDHIVQCKTSNSGGVFYRTQDAVGGVYDDKKWAIEGATKENGIYVEDDSLWAFTADDELIVVNIRNGKIRASHDYSFDPNVYWAYGGQFSFVRGTENSLHGSFLQGLLIKMDTGWHFMESELNGEGIFRQYHAGTQPIVQWLVVAANLVTYVAHYIKPPG